MTGNRTTHALLSLTPALILLTGCTQLGARPTVKDMRSRITGIDLRGVDLALDVDIQNPYLIPIKTPKFRYGLDVQDVSFLNADADAKLDLPAGRVGTTTLPVRIEYASLWKLASNLATAKQLNYKLHGTLLLSALGDSFEIPLEHAGTFPVLHLPKFSVKDVNFADVSLSGARVVVDTEVQNPNIFSVGTTGLGYLLRLGDTDVGGITAATAKDIAAESTGTLQLNGEVNARSALMKLLGGGSLGSPSLTPKGEFSTPYGPVKLPD